MRALLSFGGRRVFGQGADCPLAVHVLSRPPVRPWTKQISTVALGQSRRTFTPSGKEGIGRLSDGSGSVLACDGESGAALPFFRHRDLIIVSSA